MQAPIAFAEKKIDTSKLAIARKCLRQAKLMWMANHHLSKNYKDLSKDEQEWEMNHAILSAYDAYKVARMNVAWKPDDGDFSDDEDDELAEAIAKVEDAKKALKKAALAALGIK